jgi:tRNA A-37 threonylcarbamoyl transferase component Bud32
MGENNKRFALEAKVMLKDRYRIERLMGNNGLSMTYEAFDTFREQKIVIKELYPETIVERSKNDKMTVSCTKFVHESDFAQMKEHMIKEAKLLIRLYPLEGASNVITFFEENQTVYIVMEYVEGISLPAYLQKIHRPRILLKDAFQLLRPVIVALQKAHLQGVVHGKINPDLIYIKEDGQAVLLGFGDPMEDAGKAVAEDATARIPGYAPVEEYMDEGGFGPATDIYSIAAILYEMVTGHKVPAFYERISEENPEGRDPLLPPAYYNGTVMDYQSKAIMKALSIYHFDRYQSLEAFAQDISEEEFAETYQIRMREKPVKFAEKVKYYRIAVWGSGICLVFLLLFFLPKFMNYQRDVSAKNFYLKLESADLYEQCEMVAGLSESKREKWANDYTQMDEDGEYTIHYYDKITKRFVTRSQLDLKAALVRYISLDYRMNQTAILTFVEDGEIRELTITLTPDAEGNYTVSERISGTENEDGIYKRVAVSQ